MYSNARHVPPARNARLMGHHRVRRHRVLVDQLDQRLPPNSTKVLGPCWLAARRPRSIENSEEAVPAVAHAHRQ